MGKVWLCIQENSDIMILVSQMIYQHIHMVRIVSIHLADLYACMRDTEGILKHKREKEFGYTGLL